MDDDPLLFDESFDAVILGDEVLILNQTGFERSLRFLELARRAAESTVRQAIAKLAIANADEFVAAVMSDVNMVSKTRSIALRLADPGYAERMTHANLRAAAQEHPQIDLEWEKDDETGEEVLVFHPDPARRWMILTVLDNSYVQSLVTQVVYETNSKHQLD